ncbi:MAG: hypothetical protein O2854_05275, partial [Chloroflexi bacterium]|nr:hypothetical protein [Chloroflexota bacterium]
INWHIGLQIRLRVRTDIMSWEEISSNELECPCGEGTYTAKSFVDDWNRSERRWEMNCPKCKQVYLLHTYYEYESGKSCGSHVWVRKEHYEAVQKIKTQLVGEKEHVVNLAERRYMQAWLSYFEDAKSKKEIWRRLTEAGRLYPGLATFYSHTKHMNPETYLRREFSYKNLPKILQKLNIIDEPIQLRLRATMGLEEGLDEAENRLIREGHR